MLRLLAYQNPPKLPRINAAATPALSYQPQPTVPWRSKPAMSSRRTAVRPIVIVAAAAGWVMDALATFARSHRVYLAEHLTIRLALLPDGISFNGAEGASQAGPRKRLEPTKPEALKVRRIRNVRCTGVYRNFRLHG